MSILNKLSGLVYRGSRRVRNKLNGIYSNFDEQVMINKYVNRLGIKNRLCVDIAAGDGISMSNTYRLFKDGWKGLAVEYDAVRFARLANAYKNHPDVYLAKCKVTPVNVVALLKANQLPADFGFLNLDIDGYDYFVLAKILAEFRPFLICVEINEKIPPPIKFTVKWDSNYCWQGDHFYGQSISQLYTLCLERNYSLVEVHYNNAFLVPSEFSACPDLKPELAYQLGYFDKKDRKLLFPWNANLEIILTLQPREAVFYLNRYFEKYQGKYVCEL
ncbi:MAG: hypothetical protein MUF81_00270 [Verrucomicrobia bacterium]|jgi:hypothetical protein|nr:hypothetical protein [Verrucomicrobiota bacterium]